MSVPKERFSVGEKVCWEGKGLVSTWKGRSSTLRGSAEASESKTESFAWVISMMCFGVYSRGTGTSEKHRSSGSIIG